MKNSPLKNIRIIDLSRLYPGPLCTLVLSDMGSEVIKIESPDNNGDLMRNTPANFEALNRGKKSISLNLSKKEGKCSLFKLIEISDVIVESFRPGVFEKLLNVTVSDLRKMFPHLIVARISAFGQNESKMKFIPAHDMNSLAYAGIFGLSGLRKPMPIQAVDLITGYTCAAQIIAAIHQRSKGMIFIAYTIDQKGAYIDVSMYDVAASTGILALSQHFTTKKPISDGRDEPCYTIYRTGNGYISCGCLEPHFWKKFCEELGLSEISGMKHAFATGKDGDKVMALVTDKLSSKSAVEWHEFFTHSSRNLPITRVRAPEELYGDDLLEKRKMILTMPTVDGTTTCVMKPALDYTNFVTSNDHHAPTLGEHNQYLSDLLLSKM